MERSVFFTPYEKTARKRGLWHAICILLTIEARYAGDNTAPWAAKRR